MNDPPGPMVELSSVTAIAFQAGKDGARQYLRDQWKKILFLLGSIMGYFTGILSMVVHIYRDTP